MKYPQLISIADALSEFDQFDAIIDARSEGEFAEDHLPGAINCPVLNNAERVRVGTCYKQVGAFEAKKIGAAIVARNIAAHLEQQFSAMPREWRPLIYCWRGGNRSGSMATIFAKIGWPVAQIDGGYKEFRRHVNDSLPRLAQQFQWHVLCGPTGSCKSKLLQALSEQGAQVLDLETLAGHRGSVLGNLPEHQQPSQKSFETQIWNTLRRFDPEQVVYVEAESKKIGKLRVPEDLMTAIRAGHCIHIDMTLAARIKFLCDDYRHLSEDTTQLSQQLAFLMPLHGRERLERWTQLIEGGEVEKLVEELLQQHYDPAYQKSVLRNFKHISEARHLSLSTHAAQEISELAAEITKKT